MFKNFYSPKVSDLLLYQRKRSLTQVNPRSSPRQVEARITQVKPMVAVKTRNPLLAKVAPLAPKIEPVQVCATFEQDGEVKREEFWIWPVLRKPTTEVVRGCVVDLYGLSARYISYVPLKNEPDDRKEPWPQGNCKTFAEF
jgi:hypothetical protein